MGSEVKLPRLALSSIVKIDFEVAPFLNADIVTASNNAAMDCGTACRRRETANERQIMVEVHIRPQDEKIFIPYRCSISAVIVLADFDASLPPETMDDMGVNLAAPIGYSLIRDELQRLTSCGPHSRVILPLVGRQFLTGSATYQDESGNALPRPSVGEGV